MQKGLPLGLLHLIKAPQERYEVLDGRQRLTSIGRFVTGNFPVEDDTGALRYFSELSIEQQEKILQTGLTIYICEGTDRELRQWYETIHLAPTVHNDQELANTIYAGPFVEKAKEVFSNSENPDLEKWSVFVAGDVRRQDYLHTALEWVSHGRIDDYMRKHRYDDNIDELTAYFDSVIDWATTMFPAVRPQMRGLAWGEYYGKYHKKVYDLEKVQAKEKELYGSIFVEDRRGIYAYILGGCTDKKLLKEQQEEKHHSVLV